MLRVAVVQICSTSNIANNFAKIKEMFIAAEKQKCDLICVPECFDWIKKGVPGQPITLAEELHGPLFTQYASLASEHSMWASFGGFHEKANAERTKIRNTHVLVDSAGKMVARYSKTHLFDVDVADGRYRESDVTEAGQSLVVVNNVCGKGMNVGLSICYDLRFPALYSALRANQAHILLVPSAFMPSTGEAHWSTLLRARAIENQCYVIAAAQVGQNHETRRSYGHSIIIDPWGTVVGELDGTNEGLLVADLDAAKLESVRASIPVHNHIRADLYGDPKAAKVQVVDP